jgi:hypothetical protein
MPVWRPLQVTLAGSQHLIVHKWCVPGDVKVAGGGVSDPVKRTKGLIAFYNFLLGSLVQIYRTGLYLLFFLVSFF